MLKSVSSGGTRVGIEELWQEEAILNFEVGRLFCKWNCGRGFSRWNCSEVIADLGV